MNLINSFFATGVAVIAGFTMGKVMNRIKVPAVAGYVLVGFILGESIFGFFSGAQFEYLSIYVLTPLALSFIAFLIGSELQYFPCNREQSSHLQKYNKFALIF